MNPEIVQVRGLARAWRRAFTITEMLVVVSIVVILIALAVPSFQAMIKGSEETLAENQIKLATKAARDVAIRSGRGNDAAAVFFFTEEGRVQIVPYVKVTTIRDEVVVARVANPLTVEREVFVPAIGAQSLQLPKNWTVRAYVPPGYIENNVNDGWYAINDFRYDDSVANWVFPENAFYNPDDPATGPTRSTFMIRFAGGTGQIVTSPADPVLLLAPVMSTAAIDSLAQAAGTNPTTGARLSEWHRVIGEDASVYVRRILKTGFTNNSGQIVDLRQRILGRRSTDMVLARPVTQIALTDETRIARALGVTLRRDWPALTEPDNNPERLPQFVTGADAGLINAWIEGDTNNDGQYGRTGPSVTSAADRDEVEAKVYVFDRYTGTPRRAEIQREPQ